MRWLIPAFVFGGLLNLGEESRAQFGPPEVVEEELRAFPDEPPATPAVLPAVYSRPRRSQPRAAQSPRPTKTAYTIPAGKFGLQLNDGTRLIGLPGGHWLVTLKTGFGLSTIPLAQVQSIVAKSGGLVCVHLTNGDRLTGSLVSKSIPYNTRFGSLNVPSSALVSLQRGGTSVAGNSGRAVRDKNVRPAGNTVPPTSDLPPPAATPPSIVDPTAVIEVHRAGKFDTVILRR